MLGFNLETFNFIMSLFLFNEDLKMCPNIKTGRETFGREKPAVRNIF